jgi:DNA-directed RNA polymerase subunit RPC12/RpoP
MKVCSYCGRENPDHLSLCAGCTTELKVSVPEPAPDVAACPNCGSHEYVDAIALESSYNPLLHHLGGWLLAMLYSASRKRQVRCVKCDTLFRIHKVGSRIAFYGFAVLLVFIVLSILLAIFGD